MPTLIISANSLLEGKKPFSIESILPTRFCEDVTHVTYFVMRFCDQRKTWGTQQNISGAFQRELPIRLGPPLTLVSYNVDVIIIVGK
jgi:hypothetical protein